MDKKKRIICYVMSAVVILLAVGILSCRVSCHAYRGARTQEEFIGLFKDYYMSKDLDGLLSLYSYDGVPESIRDISVELLKHDIDNFPVGEVTMKTIPEQKSCPWELERRDLLVSDDVPVLFSVEPSYLLIREYKQSQNKGNEYSHSVKMVGIKEGIFLFALPVEEE